jgi:hypothetical protein
MEVTMPSFRRSLAVIPLAILLLLSAQPVWAAPPLPFRDGHFGIYALLDDDQGFRGAGCHYDGSMHLDRIRIRQPIAFAYDRRHGKVDRQWVAWRYAIEGTNDTADLFSATWTPVAKSDLQRYWTSDGQAAAFKPRTYSVGSSGFGALRVVVRIYWYDGSGHINGRVFAAVEDYDDLLSGMDLMVMGCLATHPV